ncbi:uncharacterized protein THITE_2156915 [Thermothielavioides terrestris NRRL 8126]|uniref:DNA 3'-5' helicase n=1 Tax=Thermothielavioides terrestris (strain ATCC 38088 / NRRL 8126) TaxID=578455 RepID=G2RGJ8_THETT|nr:uncharacterized protein THITE_2156915 [Thermothielavioides terrestris NRRL 8126]AEO71887.1 hypothetical protein THITE_2156915 [Thermothielavioides terrestris NRRL 8126]
MPSKRTAPPPETPGASKAGKASPSSSPRSCTRQSTPTRGSASKLDGPREGRKGAAAVAERPRQLDISDFPYLLRPAQDSRDFTALALEPGQQTRPVWIAGSGSLILEAFHPLAAHARDLLVAIAEPMSRPALVHEYRLTVHSLYAAVAAGLTPGDIIAALQRWCKNKVPPNVARFIQQCGKSYGKVKLVLRKARYWLETADPAVLRVLLQDPEIARCRADHGTQVPAVIAAEGAGYGPSLLAASQRGATPEASSLLHGDDDDNDDDGANGPVIHAVQIRDDKVSAVAERCLALRYPALEEYDFRNDHVNADLDIDLRPGTQIRPHQEQSLNKMFGNGRAKSGIVVLPCGAGKTLVGIAAACTIKKGVVVLATGSIAAVQWRDEFLKWTNVDPASIALFVSGEKSPFAGSTGVLITTYAMVTNTRARAGESARMIELLTTREWGLMVLDEVHVAPAQTFRTVVGCVKAHAKLGLTATLLREDDRVDDLNFLIGPKLYEASWLELSQQGHIARVQCAEVWCPMPSEFYEQYLRAGARSRPLFCAMNPTKFQACQYLIRYHESRGDKIIVFSDNVYALEVYAKKLMKPFLYGGTSNAERQEVLDYFRNSPDCSTLFLSKIGDTSLDLPEATVLIQISAQYGSRRQEAQRLGRVLRAKRRNEEGFNAFFYSLVSKDTVEMVYSAKRQVFLVDQGYAFRVITQLKNIEDMPGLAYATPQARRELLRQVLAEAESSSWRAEEEKEAAGLLADGNMFYSREGRPAARQGGSKAGPTAGRISSAVSGGRDMTYHDQKKRANKVFTEQKKAPHSNFFKAIAREKERRKKQVDHGSSA